MYKFWRGSREEIDKYEFGPLDFSKTLSGGYCLGIERINMKKNQGSEGIWVQGPGYLGKGNQIPGLSGKLEG